jgi:hypothetical protein
MLHIISLIILLFAVAIDAESSSLLSDGWRLQSSATVGNLDGNVVSQVSF